MLDDDNSYSRPIQDNYEKHKTNRNRNELICISSENFRNKKTN